MAFEKLK